MPVPLPQLQTEQTSCVDLLKALADETRLAVVRQLMGGPMRVGEINAELQVEQTLLSHHLKVLRDVGLVSAERDGKAVIYRLAPHVEAGKPGPGINLGCCSLSFE
ncbi:MAG: metalloregulator ArsR/SmtB family transcription factor [Pirellulales bacterium]|nr:metalloregulator ArsR/SmtB family transcription factor [Pirellulales bacterium]